MDVWIYKQPLPTLGFETKVRNLVVQQKVPMEENKRESALHVSKQGICTCEIEYNGNYCGHVHMENLILFSK